MNLSLQTKVSVFVTLIIVAISLISTYLFTSAYSRSIERELIARGLALSYSLSKAAEEGLMQEDLDLIGKATYLIKAEDVTHIQAFSTLWDGIDSYPFEKLQERPHPFAVSHFEKNSEPIYIKSGDRYEFYRPIVFSPIQSDTHFIGFVRLALSSSHMQKEIEKSVLVNTSVAAFITLFAVFAVNILVRRLVIKPVSELRGSIAMFKNGTLRDNLAPRSQDEIGELFIEFNKMTFTIKEKEASLIESEKRIKHLFERVEHAIFRLDREGNIIETSRRFNELFGNVKKLCYIFWMGEKTVPDCLELANSGKSVHLEKKAFDLHGNDLDVLLSLYPETDENGEFKGYDGYIIDMTEKKKLERALLHTQKMEAVGTLAGGIAHDFNNMLQGIMGYTSLIKMNLSEGDALYKPISVIELSASRAADLTRQLLGFARGGKYITKPANLNTAVNNVLQIISRTFDKTVEIKLSLEKNLWTVEADQSQIEHSILNFCLNARDAMPAGGLLHIETQNYEGTPPSPDAPDGKYAVIRISDTGIGMDKKIQQRIFEPFFTTKEKPKGIGMGLAMAYGVIKNHGGFIAVDSDLGSGSAFTVYLPAVEKAVETDAIITDEAPRGQGTVLIVDDEDAVRDFTVSALTQCGYDIIEARDGQEAIEVFKQRKDEIGVVILDIIMPKMGGKETFEILKKIKPGVKVLVSSGYSINGSAQDIINAGADSFIQKPFSVNALATKMKEVLTRRKA